MKLKDYKKNPEQYNELKRICAERGIKADDETDMVDILAANNSLDARIKMIGFSFDRSREKK